MAGSVAARARESVPIVATIAFFVLGFAAHGWGWAWIVFFAVPLVYTFTKPQRDGRPPVSLRKGPDR